MKKLTWKKGIKTIHIPIYTEISGESIKAIEKVAKTTPKFSTIKFVRTICLKKNLEYDLTEVIIEK